MRCVIDLERILYCHQVVVHTSITDFVYPHLLSEYICYIAMHSCSRLYHSQSH